MPTCGHALAAVTSNGVPVPFDDEHFMSLPDSSSLLDDPDALRARFAEEGCLLLRGILDPAAVCRLRGAYFSRFGSGYLAAGTSPADGMFSGRVPRDLPPHGTPGHPAHAFVRCPEFAAFVADPRLALPARLLLGGDVVVLPRQILRHFTAGSRTASRAHIDHDYMDRGTDRVVTTWVPVGDCPLEAGGLVYLERSHQLGRADLAPLHAVTDRPHDRRVISHDLARTAERLGRRWQWADYRPGDVAVHSPHVVHASLDTTTPRMRMSVDVRFIRAGDQADERWSRPWSGDDGN